MMSEEKQPSIPLGLILGAAATVVGCLIIGGMAILLIVNNRAAPAPAGEEATLPAATAFPTATIIQATETPIPPTATPTDQPTVPPTATNIPPTNPPPPPPTSVPPTNTPVPPTATPSLYPAIWPVPGLTVVFNTTHSTIGVGQAIEFTWTVKNDGGGFMRLRSIGAEVFNSSGTKVDFQNSWVNVMELNPGESYTWTDNVRKSEVINTPGQYALILVVCVPINDNPDTCPSGGGVFHHVSEPVFVTIQ